MKDVIKEGNYYRCCDSQPVQSDSYGETGSGGGRDLILTDLDEMQVKIKIDLIDGGSHVYARVSAMS
jgi:hypothetical protein